MNELKKIEAVLPGNAGWWRGAAIYQIYPRSFADSNGDGIGDLPGITAKLDYVASLGVDAIWLSPFFISPMCDFGYDVADYCDVDPIFGTLADFDSLVAKAHGLGLKLIIDQVYSHTSDRHDWFTQSRASRDNLKSDWYVWADPKADGSPPTNWQSVFGGPAWTWDARRGQYYLHNFLSQQPQLNVHNRDVQDALLGVAKFWLDRGVDGFRVDAINFAMHDPQLRDNPPAPSGKAVRTRPFDFQLKLYNQSHPDIPAFIERIRALTDRYPDRFTVAEVGGDNPEPEMKAFTEGDTHFNSAYGFDFLYAEKLTPQLVQKALDSWPEAVGMGWPSWAFSNHDAPRWTSRWAPAEQRDAYTRMALLLLTCLRGNIILWQGEELGLTQVDIPFEQLQDPEAIANWPLTLSRDGTRTPMPWVAQDEQGGFTSGQPWLPLGEANLARAVDRQEGNPQSLLNFTRSLLAMRNAHPALREGKCIVELADDKRLVLRREGASETLWAIFNLSAGPAVWPDKVDPALKVLQAVNDAKAGALPPYAAILLGR